MQFHRSLVAASLVALLAAPAFSADANAGRGFFRAQCALCHSAEPNDNGGAQGPSLQGVLGRKAASGAGFSYSPALKSSGLTWDEATLLRFLAAPTTVVPGSAMVIPVPQQSDRENIVAYFTGVKDGTLKAAAGPAGPPGGFRPPPPPATAPTGTADWKNDAPGRVHRVDLARLPAPFETASANNFPRLVPQPEGAKLSLPAGFKVEVYLTGLTAPRAMKVAANGDVLLAETNAGRIKVLRPAADGSTATATVFAQGLLQPYGIAFYPSAANAQWLYVAEMNRVVRYPYKSGDTVATAVPEVIVPQLSPVGGGHFTRDIAFSADGKRMYISVGSQSNVAEDITKKSADEIKAWEGRHGFGAAWGNEENRASVRVFDVNGDTQGRNFATGIRNCVGMTVQPATGALWCVTNERDMLGDNLVPDYATRVKEGAYYGWPWYYMGNHEDPRLKGHRPDLAGKASVPDVPFTAHSAAVNILFYTANKGRSAFPKEYAGQGIVVLHGSWNRAFRTGHKLVRLPVKGNVPTGEYVDFMTGFITESGDAWGRPVAITQLHDGSLLLADDGSNQIYRIYYSRGK
jgi:glucose/arabinose dehydrogenase/cytochrome c2